MNIILVDLLKLNRADSLESRFIKISDISSIYFAIDCLNSILTQNKTHLKFYVYSFYLALCNHKKKKSKQTSFLNHIYFENIIRKNKKNVLGNEIIFWKKKRTQIIVLVVSNCVCLFFLSLSRFHSHIGYFSVSFVSILLTNKRYTTAKWTNLF